MDNDYIENTGIDVNSYKFLRVDHLNSDFSELSDSAERESSDNQSTLSKSSTILSSNNSSNDDDWYDKNTAMLNSLSSDASLNDSFYLRLTGSYKKKSRKSEPIAFQKNLTKKSDHIAFQKNLTKKDLKKAQRANNREIKKNADKRNKKTELLASKKDKFPITTYLTDSNLDMQKFIKSPAISKTLPMAPKAARSPLLKIAKLYNLTIKKHGKNKHKFYVVTKSQITIIPPNWKIQLASIISSPKKFDLSKMTSKLSLSEKTKNTPKLLNDSVGQTVGSSAAPIGDENIGHQLLMKLGWKPGQSLGNGDGIVNPISAVIRKYNAGLGTV